MFSRKTSLLTVIAILTASACTHLEESFVENATPDMKKMTVEAAWGDSPETRTAMQSNGIIFWSPGDEINLFYGSSTASKFTATITEPSATASFEGMLGAATGSSEQGIATQTFWGIYPYDSDNTCDGDGVTLSIRATQTSLPGSFGEGMNPAVAVSPGLSLSFYNVGSWFIFSVTEEGITSATFSGNNDEDIAGRVRVTMDSSERPTSEVVSGGGVKSISIKPAGGGSFVPNTNYYITLIPQTLSNGYTFTLFKGDEVATRKTSKSKTFGRSSHVSAENIDNGLTWQTICVELGPGVKWAKMNVGASSPEESGNYYAWGETVPKDEYTNTNYVFGTYRALTKYVNNSEYGTVDNITALLLEDDAATAAWGGDWRIPTWQEWTWLEENCTVEASTENGVSGFRFTSKIDGYTDKSIFIPSAGYYNYDTTFKEGFSYWSSVMCDDGDPAEAWMATPYKNRAARFTGRPVRAVYMPRVSLTSIAMTQSSITVGVDFAHCLYVEKTPSDATEKGVIWTSSNESVAKVNCAGEVTGVSPGTATITAVSVDGGFSTNCTVTVIPSYVDMGGGMEWATFNVGADTPTDAGSYFAWGMTYTPGSYSWNSYSLGREDNMWHYNSTDGLVNLMPRHDAATNWMGGLWHIPSSSEWDWLLRECFWDWDSDYQNSGMPGWVVTSEETNGSIFLPAAGEVYDDNEAIFGTGYYWTSNLHPEAPDYNYAAAVSLPGEILAIVADKRYHGKTIRAVRRKWVDMGDGLKWATTNVGGFNSEDYGSYFAWGEITPKEDYSWSTYKWGTSPTALTRYVTDEAYGTVDNRTELVRSATGTDDAAMANWGATWRMPTYEEWAWLRNKNNCTWVWTTENGVKGRKVTSSITGNSIFLPAAGRRDGTALSSAGYYGYYWSSSLDESTSYGARLEFFGPGSTNSGSNDYRYNGFSVRPVSD